MLTPDELVAIESRAKAALNSDQGQHYYVAVILASNVPALVAALREAWEDCRTLAGRYDLAIEQRNEARAGVERVRARHVHQPPIHGYYDKTGFCRHCHTDWPCDTIRDLDGEA